MPRSAFGSGRREIQRSLPKEAAKEWKGTRWLWLTNPENLTPEQQAELRALKERFPALARWSEHREALRQIFDDPAIHTPEEGRWRLMAWCERGCRNTRHGFC
jgi:transposase